MSKIKALIFDCDGVLVDTERDGLRVSFNRAFKAKGLNTEWDIPLYGRLLNIAGGKERMKFYFDENGWPENISDKDNLQIDVQSHGLNQRLENSLEIAITSF